MTRTDQLRAMERAIRMGRTMGETTMQLAERALKALEQLDAEMEKMKGVITGGGAQPLPHLPRGE